MSWQYSRLGFAGLVGALRSHPVWPQVEGQLREPLASLVSNPQKQTWVDGSLIEELSESVFNAGGAAAVEDIYFRHVNHRLGGLMIPFVKVALALARNDPRAFLSRMNISLAPVSQGLVCTWTELTPTSGVVSVAHGDHRPPLHSRGAWVGIIKFGFDLCGLRERFTCEASVETSKSSSLNYRVAWK